MSINKGSKPSLVSSIVACMAFNIFIPWQMSHQIFTSRNKCCFVLTFLFVVCFSHTVFAQRTLNFQHVQTTAQFAYGTSCDVRKKEFFEVCTTVGQTSSLLLKWMPSSQQEIQAGPKPFLMCHNGSAFLSFASLVFSPECGGIRTLAHSFKKWYSWDCRMCGVL